MADTAWEGEVTTSSCVGGTVAVTCLSGVRREEVWWWPGSAAGWMVEAPLGK